MNYFKNRFSLLILAAILFLFSFFGENIFVFHSDNIIARYETQLHSKELTVEKELDNLVQISAKKSYENIFKNSPEHYQSLFEKEGIVLLIYENDTLKFWSDNSVAVENYIKEVCLDNSMAKLKNGWFEVIKGAKIAGSAKVIIGLLLIKNEFPYQNQYLENNFADFLMPSAKGKLIEFPTNSNNTIRNKDGIALFDIVFDEPFVISKSWNIFNLIIIILVFLVLLIYVWKACARLFQHSKTLPFIVYISAVAMLRYLSTTLNFPNSLYDNALFSPEHFADSSSIWLNSLGDLLINSSILLLFSYLFRNHFSINKSSLQKKHAIAIPALIFGFLFALSWLINKPFLSVIRNSNISFNLNDLFSLSSYSYLSLIAVNSLLISFFVISDKLIDILNQLQFKLKNILVPLLIVSVIYTAVCDYLGILDMVLVLWPLVIILTIIFFKTYREKTYSFSSAIILVLLFSGYAAHVIIKNTRLKEYNNRILYAEKLATEQDPIAELLFSEIEKKLSNDSILASYLSHANYDLSLFEKRIRQNYFTGEWEKYDLKIALFDTLCNPLLINSPSPENELITYYDEQIHKHGEETFSKNFFYINNSVGKISYLAKIPIHNKNQSSTTKSTILYLSFDSKFISEELGFPDLLLDKSVTLNKELANYSYAKYKNGKMVNRFGKYSYPLEFSEKINFSDKSLFKNDNDYNHLYFSPEPSTLIIISQKNIDKIGAVTTFSYLFTIFSFLLLVWVSVNEFIIKRTFSKISFKLRIQMLLVFIVLVSLFLFGAGTVYYIQQQYESKNKENISEKIRSVLIEVESKLGAEKKLGKDFKEYSSYVLKKFSTVFFTDINLYDANGNLYASSRQKLFEEGLSSTKMNPEAYNEIALNGKTEFIHDENIGKLKYLSAYIPFKNQEGKVLAYLNLPYFAKQSELEKEISTFLAALINIYVFLFVLSVLIAIFISNYLTKPLMLIQNKMSLVKLGKSNELIEWKQNDEIGSLVREYNRMIVELTNSADLLAKSERESAWREMAKQVAHEIKNPLTPMRLSVQHLQRTWKDNAPDMGEKINRITQTLVEQIDTLSAIANEFSHFAKMPKPNINKINICSTIESVIDLFYNTPNIKISIHKTIEDDAGVMADKEQLIRIFNNLIKNAIQSIPEERKGKVEIKINRKDKHLLIAIKDNGTGISDEIAEKIFTPNFTTKTTGMGLGLAMVKNLIEGFEGNIWFETKENIGTTFYVSLPEANEF